MIYFISIIHALTCIFVVLFILLQDPKGGVLGTLGGGHSKAFFGSEGMSPFLVKVTKWLAICFALSSFYLSYMSSKEEGSIMETSFSSMKKKTSEKQTSKEKNLENNSSNQQKESSTNHTQKSDQ